MPTKFLQNSGEDLTVKEAFEKFYSYSKSKNLSEATLDYYAENFNRFLKVISKFPEITIVFGK